MLSRSLLLSVLMMAVAIAWSASPNDSFLDASVKLSENQNPVLGTAGSPPIPSGPISTLSLRHATLQGLITRAYDIRYRSVSGPTWMESTYYDVVAKVPSGAQGQKVAEMLQKLLMERLNMRIRWETRLVDGWGLVVGSTPVKLKQTAPEELDPKAPPRPAASVSLKGREKSVFLHATSMNSLANSLWGNIDEPVQDLTALKGTFDIKLEGEVDEPASFSSFMSPASIKKSLRGYGLDLIRQKVQVRTLRIDSVTKIPKPN